MSKRGPPQRSKEDDEDEAINDIIWVFETAGNEDIGDGDDDDDELTPMPDDPMDLDER